MLTQARTFAYGTLAVTLDLLARPLFALIHHKRRPR